MTARRDTNGGRTRRGRRTSRRPNRRSPDAEELKRIVEVAEELRMDPHVVRVVLELEDGWIQTDVSLWDSVRTVERVLGREERATHTVARPP